MQNKELEFSSEVEIPIAGKDGKTFTLRPSVSLRVTLDEDDDIEAVATVVSNRCKALFVVEACKQARSLSAMATKGFEAVVKETLEAYKRDKEAGKA